jgi:hypothetical protein
MKTPLTMIPCPKCGEDFPELRKTQYGYNFCVNCSGVEKKVGITTVEGTGDHTYNDLIIMDASKARKIAELEAYYSGNKKVALELQNWEDENESEVSQSLKESINRVLEDDIDVEI